MPSRRPAGKGFSAAIGRFALPSPSGPAQECLCIARKEGLLAAAQLGVLEFHIWGVHRDDIERPGRLVLDLDPDPAVAFPAVARAAAELRDALEALGLKSFPLLIGGKGVHAVVPLTRRHGWSTVAGFARALAERFAQEAPDRFVADMRKARRTGRIFIDFFRNDKSASAIAPYSPRARAGASVAWPVSWAELARAKAADLVTISTASPRLAKADPWKDYFTTRQSLGAPAIAIRGRCGLSVCYTAGGRHEPQDRRLCADRRLRDRRTGGPRRIDRLAVLATLRQSRLLCRAPGRARARTLADRAPRSGGADEAVLPRRHAHS